ncbi:MAG: enoyl-CoA hydratase/isomerase family protein [Thermoplasmata archaeon]
MVEENSFSNIKIDDEEQIRTISLNRSNKLNPLDIETIKEIRDAVADSSKIIILKGSEKAFSAGADINNFLKMSERDAYHFSDLGHVYMNEISEHERPVIAAIHGYALGGGFELALACDFRISDVNTKYGFPEVNLGIMPGFGGTQRIKKLAGESYGMYIVMTGNVIDENEALKHGIINTVSPNYYEEAQKLAKILSEKPATSVKYIKDVMKARADNMYDIEKERFAMTFKTEDHIEGIKAFQEKRKAVFKGK